MSIKPSIENMRFGWKVAVAIFTFAGATAVAHYRLSLLEMDSIKNRDRIELVEQRRQADHDALIAITNQLGQIGIDVRNVWKKINGK